jgi:phosphate-selective porin OprO/OprP
MARIQNWYLLTAISAFLISVPAFADPDTETRMAELQKQVESLSKELQAIQQQLAQSKEEQVRQKGKSQGSPVFAAFKDGIVFEDGTGNWKMAINGRVQGDYRQFSPDVDAADTFSLRRARLGATMTFYKDYSIRVEGEYSGGSTTLTYGYIDISKFAAAKFRLGQFKPFYGLERSMSTNFTDFQERSMADTLLGSTYDRGVMMFGSPFTGLNYSLAYINGTGTSDENDVKSDSKDITGRVTANFAEMAGWKNAVVHVGGFYAKGNEASDGQSGFIPSVQTEGRGLQFFRSAVFADDVERIRGGYEAALAHGPVKLQSEYIATSFDGTGFDRDMHAWYASAVWNVTGESFADMYKGGLFGRLKPKNSFKESGGWGAFQLGARYTKFDASDFSSTNAAGTGVLLNNPAGAADGLLVATNEADAWTLGLNWILNPNVRLVTNYVRTSFDSPVLVRVNGANESLDKEEALTMRAQFDF